MESNELDKKISAIKSLLESALKAQQSEKARLLKKAIEMATGDDNAIIKNIKKLMDGFQEHAEWSIRKFANDADYAANKPYAICPIHGNELTNAGINLMLSAICVTGQTLFSNANAYLCVGDSTTAFAATQTDLQASTNKLRKAMDASYPTYGTAQKATWKSTFASGDANYAWQEFAVANASTGGTILNRKVSSQGTKVSGQVWELSLEVSLS